MDHRNPSLCISGTMRAATSWITFYPAWSNMPTTSRRSWRSGRQTTSRRSANARTSSTNCCQSGYKLVFHVVRAYATRTYMSLLGKFTNNVRLIIKGFHHSGEWRLSMLTSTNQPLVALLSTSVYLHPPLSPRSSPQVSWP